MEDKIDLMDDIDYLFIKFKESLSQKSPRQAIRLGNQLKMLIDAAVVHKSTRTLITNNNKNGKSN